MRSPNRVLLHFFVLFCASYAIGVIFLHYTVSLCKPKVSTHITLRHAYLPLHTYRHLCKGKGIKLWVFISNTTTLSVCRTSVVLFDAHAIGMPYFAYLGQMLETVALECSLRGWQDCPNPFKWHPHSLSLCLENSLWTPQISISSCHTLCITGRHILVCTHGQVWGLVPLGYVNSPPTPHQAPGEVGRAYHW